MPFNVSMTDQQKFPLGVTILDADGKPFAALSDIPGATLDFVSSDPNIVSVAVREDGMNADIGSGNPGTATVTVTPGGAIANLAGDMVTVQVVNSAPGSINLTVGAPQAE